jgi:hypothetical protein
MASSSPLPELARITTECTILPLLLTLWTGNAGVSLLVNIFFQIVIREGFSVNSPFPYPLPNDEFDGRRIMNAIYVIYIIAFAILGKILLYMVDLPSFLCLFTLFPKKYIGCEYQQDKLMFGISLLWILVTALGTYLTYKMLLDRALNVAAVIVINVVPIGMFVLGFILFRYWSKLYTKYREMMVQYNSKPLERRFKKKYLRYNIIAYFVFVGIVVVLGNLVISVILYFQYDVNWTALSAPPLFLFYIAFGAFMMWFKGFIFKKLEVTKYEKIEEDEGLSKRLK